MTNEFPPRRADVADEALSSIRPCCKTILSAAIAKLEAS